MSTSKRNAKPATTPRAAEAQLRTLIGKFAPEHLRLINATRRSLRMRLPTAHEVVYEYRSWFVISFSPTGQGYEGVLAIRADTDGIKLYFNRGKELPDPEKLLRGSGSLVRLIDLDASTLARPAVARLIDEAVSCNQIPFAPTGRGSVIIRAASAKKKRASLKNRASKKA